MDKKSNIGRMSLVCSVLIIFVVAVVLGNSLRRTAYVTLPEDTTDTEQGDGDATDNQTAINTIEVTPTTVQAIIRSLQRSDYRRTLRIEQIWSGGSGMREVQVTQQGDLQRTDEVLSDGRVQHVITTEDTYYLWHDEEQTVYQGAMGAFTVDQYQGIPTYEDVLALDQWNILTTSYESLSDVRCIYVETAMDDKGYQTRYWISVDSGLLVAAERLEDNATIYRMAVVADEVLLEDNAYFQLPDGTVLPEEISAVDG